MAAKPETPDQIAALRAAIAAIAAVESGGAGPRAVLPLCAGGEAELALGAWHEIGGAGMESETCAAPAAFTARIAAALAARGEVVWVLRRDDLYAPGLAYLGFAAQRLIEVCVAREAEALAVVEEALGTPGVAAVIGESERISLVGGRRLQLACERTGATGLMLLRKPYGGASKTSAGSAAFSRWQVVSAPSEPVSGAPGLGPHRWHVELLRRRGGRPGAWFIEETSHGPHPFAVVAPLGDRRVATQDQPQRLAG